jgi:hypothetical protein
MRPVVIAACLLAASCSRKSGAVADGGPSPSASLDPATKFAHPCSLLSRSDAEEILESTDLQPLEEPGPPGDSHCVWAVNGARGFVELRVQFPSRKASFDQPMADRRPVSAVGDRAYVQKRLSWGHVDVLKGDQTFFVQIEHGSLAGGRPKTADQVQSEAIVLARTIAGRI